MLTIYVTIFKYVILKLFFLHFLVICLSCGSVQQGNAQIALGKCCISFPDNKSYIQRWEASRKGKANNLQIPSMRHIKTNNFHHLNKSISP